MKLEFFAIPGVPELTRGANLGAVLLDSARAGGILIESQDIVAVAQKVVSKVEGRVVQLEDVEPSARAIGMAQQSQKDPRLIEVILRESRRVVRCRGEVLITE